MAVSLVLRYAEFEEQRGMPLTLRHKKGQMGTSLQGTEEYLSETISVWMPKAKVVSSTALRKLCQIIVLLLCARYFFACILTSFKLQVRGVS